MTLLVTAAVVRNEALNPALDALSHNAVQERLVWNPSPERDSVLELLPTRTAPEDCARITRILTRLVASNQLERDDQRRIAGWADGAVTKLRDRELNGGRALSCRSIAREHRGDLDAISHPDDHTPARLGAAYLAIGRLLGRADDALLRSRDLRNELGQARHDLLLSLIDRAGVTA